MPKIKVITPFKHCVGEDFHATEFLPGKQEVDARTAEVALAKGWAIPLGGKKAKPDPAQLDLEGCPSSGIPFPDSGPAPRLVSLEEALASPPATSAPSESEGA